MENVKVSETKCKCVSIVRKDYDSRRKCFKYTAVMKPISDGDDIFAESDLFSAEYMCPVTDLVIRSKHENAPSDESSDEKLTKWDGVVSEAFVGKTATVKHCVVSVEFLTDGKYQSYEIEIPSGGKDGKDVTYEVSTRNLCALGDIEAAIGRARNQVLRACKEQYESEEA